MNACADCGHPKRAHAPIILPEPGYGCYAVDRPLGTVVRHPCPCPCWHDGRPLLVKPPTVAECKSPGLLRGTGHETYRGPNTGHAA